MSTRAGYWLNLFLTMTFKVNAKITGVKYISHSNTGTVDLSFWRNVDVNASEWMMVGKLELTPEMEGLQVLCISLLELMYTVYW